MNKKAVLLLSGGLDSTLAFKIMLEQGVEVYPLNFVSLFCRCTRKGCQHEASVVANKFGLNIKIMEKGPEYLEIVKNPPHGYGKNMNPCIDCRIYMLKKAKTYMKEIGASFIITGEVLGQRPMSQRRHTLTLIEKEADVEGIVLRPLSAKLFPETEMEKQGIIDRNKLLSISGRSRKEQISLAKEKNVTDYPCPAGGCLLTDPEFAKRLKDAFSHGENSKRDILLLKIGRHFRLKNGQKIIVGRNETEDIQLENMAGDGEICLTMKDIPGPSVLFKANGDTETLKTASELCVSYSDFEGDGFADVLYSEPGRDAKTILVKKIDRDEIMREICH